MMYCKAELMQDTAIMAETRRTPDPYSVKKLGRKVKPWKQSLWDSKKLDIMTDILVSKFSASSSLKEILLTTGDRELVEASPTDIIWGIGLREDNPDVYNKKKWRGKNLLGIALMRARNIIKEKGSDDIQV